MKFSHMRSDQLPEIDVSVKECVNAGQWFLFKANAQEQHICFFLKVHNDVFALGAHGEILNSLPCHNEMKMNEIIYFEDLPKPASLSNQFASVY
ncbi:hypothetical protein [Pantoea agglomerans]